MKMKENDIEGHYKRGSIPHDTVHVQQIEQKWI